MDFRYCQGYEDAIMDLYSWFNKPERKNILKDKHLKITTLLKAFFEYSDQFMKEKWDFDFEIKYETKLIKKKETVNVILTPDTGKRIGIDNWDMLKEYDEYLYNNSGDEYYKDRYKKYYKKNRDIL